MGYAIQEKQIEDINLSLITIDLLSLNKLGKKVMQSYRADILLSDM